MGGGGKGRVRGIGLVAATHVVGISQIYTCTADQDHSVGSAARWRRDLPTG